MKKTVLFFVILTLFVFMCCACSSNQNIKETGESTQPNSSASESDLSSSSGDNDVSQKKLSLEDVRNHTSIMEDHMYCGENENGNGVFMEYKGNDTIVVIPEKYKNLSITSIGKYVFGNGSIVQGLSFPDSLLEVGDYSCGSNTKLQVVVMGNNVERVGESAFQGCSSLHTVVLNDSLKTISPFAFAMCTALESIEIPSSVSTIDNTSFYGHMDGFTIIGEVGSYAEEFANANGIIFKSK